MVLDGLAGWGQGHGVLWVGGVVDFVGRVVGEVGVRFDAALVGVRGGGGGHFGG